MDQPYQAPAADIRTHVDATYQPQFFAANGRLGRMRYFVYGVGLTMLTYLALAIVGLVASLAPGGHKQAEASAGVAMLVGFLAIAAMVFLLVMTVIYAVRRLNDINLSGWMVLLMFVPLVNIIIALMLLFVPGSRGANNYGPAPVANSGGVVAGFALSLLGLVFYIGIMAAVAIPAYQDYVHRVQSMSQQMQPGGDY